MCHWYKTVLSNIVVSHFPRGYRTLIMTVRVSPVFIQMSNVTWDVLDVRKHCLLVYLWACIFCMCTADTRDVGCPIFENFTICQQPADLLTIDDIYNNAATRFIQTQKGLLLLFTLLYHLGIFFLL